MSEQAAIPGTADPRFDVARLRERECDLTPKPVVRQVVGWLARQPRFARKPPLRILDPAAGAGVYCVVARETWADAEIHAVEPASEEVEHLATLLRGRGTLHASTLQQFAASWNASHAGRFDLIITNPPFSHALAFVELCRAMLSADGLLVLLLPSRFGQKSTDEIEWMLRHRVLERHAEYVNLPDEEVQVSGTIAFRGGAGAAWDVYSHFVWGPRPRLFAIGDDPQWNNTRLPMLPGSARRWSQRPGSEIEP